ncbi:MAG: hypothetical protein Q3972_08445 [Corynebacterium sp.]|nr:hypothetical protein [Corynebacterium sp.]
MSSLAFTLFETRRDILGFRDVPTFLLLMMQAAVLATVQTGLFVFKELPMLLFVPTFILMFAVLTALNVVAAPTGAPAEARHLGRRLAALALLATIVLMFATLAVV